MDHLAHHYHAHIAELNRRVAEIVSREALSGLAHSEIVMGEFRMMKAIHTSEAC